MPRFPAFATASFLRRRLNSKALIRIASSKIFWPPCLFPNSAMIQTLVPAPIQATAHARRFGYAFTPRALLLLVAGCLLALPGFFHPRWIWAMLAWDALVLLLVILEAILLPAPGGIRVERRFDNSPVLGEGTGITIEVTQSSNQILEIRITDALHPALEPMPS